MIFKVLSFCYTFLKKNFLKKVSNEKLVYVASNKKSFLRDIFLKKYVILIMVNL